MFPWLQQGEISPHLLLQILLSFLSLISLALLFKYFNLHSYLSRSTKKLNLPPSPWRIPLIGNLHQIGSLPHRSLHSLARKHGHLMLLHFGQKPVLIVSSAEAAKEVLQTQDTIFANRPKLIAAERLMYSCRNPAFAPYGPYWRQTRKIAVLQLLSASRVESYESVRKEEVALTMDKIRESCSSSSVVNLSQLVAFYTSSVVCRVALGRKYDGDMGGLKFWEIVGDFMYLLGVFNIGDYMPWLAWINHFNGVYARLEKSKKNLDFIFERVIEEHVQRKSESDSGGEGVEDFVDVLLRIEKDNSLGVPFDRDCIKAILLDMFVAGIDTSATTVVWAMTELVKHPEMMKDVQMEVRDTVKVKPCITEDDLDQMHNLKMVIKETLRLHTPAPLLLPREVIQDTNLLGFHVAAKTVVFINAWAIGKDPVSWEEPDEFRPQRFLNTSVDYKGRDFGAIPFGGGRRGCPGILFATPTMELMLANLLCHFDWSLPCGEDMDMAEVPGTTAHKRSPLLLVATPSRV